MGAMAVPLGLLFGGAAALLGGIAYQLLIHWIPFIYVNILLTLGFGALLGLLTGLGLRRGQLRNNIVAAALCTVVGAGAVGCTHLVAYENFLRNAASETGEPTSVLREQLSMEQFMALRAKGGWKVGRSSSGRSAMTGGFVYFVWGVESLILIGFAIFVGVSLVSDPYCEGCKEWTTEHKLPDRTGASVGLIKADADAGRLGSIVARKDEGRDIVAYTVHSCPRCPDTSYLTVEKVTFKEKNKGQIERSTDAIVRRAALTPELRKQALEGGSAAASETPPVPPDVPAPPSAGADEART